MSVLQEHEPVFAARHSFDVGSSGSPRGRHSPPLPRFPGVTRARYLLFGAKTPWKRVRLTCGLGTSAASRAMTAYALPCARGIPYILYIKSRGSKITWVVPSRYGVFSWYRTLPFGVSDRRFSATAGRLASFLSIFCVCRSGEAPRSRNAMLSPSQATFWYSVTRALPLRVFVSHTRLPRILVSTGFTLADWMPILISLVVTYVSSNATGFNT